MNSEVGPSSVEYVCRVSRIAVLWEHLTGYTQAALDALLQAGSTRLFVVQRSLEENAGFAPYLRDRCEVISLCADTLATADWLERLEAFAPDLAIVTSTKDARYRRAARRLHARGTLVVWASDVPARSILRDLYGMVRSRAGFWRGYDAAFVCGRKAAQYARRIGFPPNRIFTGLYSCDTQLFRSVGLARHGAGERDEWPRRFLFVGQLIERKGIDILLEAYQHYRQRARDPWELWCAGTGPLRSRLEGVDGIHVSGFLPPDGCAALMGRAGALVLPSRLDHWPLVIHEATSAGLPVIASRTCFSTLELVEDGINGFVFPPGDASRLADLLEECAGNGRARAMGRESLRVSYRADPSIFAANVLDYIPATICTGQHRAAGAGPERQPS